MTLSCKNLPIGIQTFRKIRENSENYYVDKTAYALKLMNGGTHYFLSRPRRFGKSLFLDTLAELFSGHQELFQGLYCYDRWDWNVCYPVIRISWGGGVAHTREALDQTLHQQLTHHEKANDLPAAFVDLRSRFVDLIERLHAKTGLRVVILVDEYDKPILDNITDHPVAREMRDGLRNLYSVIKDSDAHIKFAFLTGVSKFSKVSLFSGLNNLYDITVSAEYSALCGYTDADLDTTFAAELPGLDRHEIRHWYNGYNWLGESVYNPYDILLLFKDRLFKAHWFETATPGFLVDVLRDRQTWLPELGQLQSDADLLSTFDVDDMSTEALMFQSGYLTLGETEILGGNTYYRLRFPNYEVYRSLHASLLKAWTPNSQQNIRHRMSLYKLIEANDFDGLHKLFKSLYDSIPNQWFTKNPIAHYEGYYASVFYCYFCAAGFEVTPEKSSNAGRLDMVLRFNGHIYIFEFKVVLQDAKGQALQQIKDRGYANPYLSEGEPIHLIGVEFSTTRRSVVGFDVETL